MRIQYFPAPHTSAQYGAVGQGDGVAVKMDGAVVGETGEGAVAGERPGAAAFDGNGRVVADGAAVYGRDLTREGLAESISLRSY